MTEQQQLYWSRCTESRLHYLLYPITLKAACKHCIEIQTDHLPLPEFYVDWEGALPLQA